MSISALLEKNKLRVAKRVAEAEEDLDLSLFLNKESLTPRTIAEPFPHVVIDNIFTLETYTSLEQIFQENFNKGLSQSITEMDKFHPFDIEYDGYLLTPPPQHRNKTPLSVFYSVAWNMFFSRLFKQPTTFETSLAFHHHPPGDSTGFVHHDFVDKYFDIRARQPNMVIPFDTAPARAIPPHLFLREKRIISILFYLANPPWRSGDGGETGLYTTDQTTLAKSVAPVNNRLVAFHTSPRSFHAFQSNTLPRNCIVQWFHMPEEFL